MMNPEREKDTIQVSWDIGAAFDFFISLRVLHKPEDFGLRGSWAAGVRSRLASYVRKILEQAQDVTRVPLGWIHHLPQPKNTQMALSTLAQIPAAQRLPELVFSEYLPAGVKTVLEEVAAKKSWSDAHIEALRSAYPNKDRAPRQKQAELILEWWSNSAEYGERLLEALQAYYNVFFFEEERRIQPILQQALADAQATAEGTSLPALLEELSHGVRFASLDDLSELVLAPSFWSAPLIVFQRITPSKGVVVFGSRPADIPLVPGDLVPEPLLLALKALADPTRLRILRYLASDSLTPSQLARLLRLRAPTVIHHLNALRLAGLVQLTLKAEAERKYAIRKDAVESAFSHIQSFIFEQQPNQQDNTE